MNKKQKAERALQWINEINVHHEIIEGRVIVDDQWKDAWLKVLTEAPEKIFAQPGFYEVVELYAWKEIVKQNLGPDNQAAFNHLTRMLATLAGELPEFAR